MKNRAKYNMSKRRKRALNTRQKIFNTTIELIKKNGYEHVNVVDIIKESGVSVGSFYNHYKTIDNILLQSSDVLLERYQMYIDKMDENLHEIDKIMYLCKVRITVNFELSVNIVGAIYARALLNRENLLFKSSEGVDLINTQIHDLLISSRKKGHLKADADLDSFIEELLMIITGYLVTMCLKEEDADEYNNRFEHIVRNQLKAIYKEVSL